MNAALLAIVTLLSAANIAPEHRVANTEKGVCWWSCADSVARQYDIKHFVGIRDAVLESGFGAADGAGEVHILYWLYATNTKFAAHHDVKDDRFLTKYVDAGHAPIVTLKWGVQTMPDGKRKPLTHALILTDVYKRRNKWYVKYVDPNDVSKDFVQEWAWFRARWIGDAYVLLPGPNVKGAPVLVLP